MSRTWQVCVGTSGRAASPPAVCRAPTPQSGDLFGTRASADASGLEEVTLAWGGSECSVTGVPIRTGKCPCTPTLGKCCLQHQERRRQGAASKVWGRSWFTPSGPHPPSQSPALSCRGPDEGTNPLGLSCLPATGIRPLFRVFT